MADRRFLIVFVLGTLIATACSSSERPTLAATEPVQNSSYPVAPFAPPSNAYPTTSPPTTGYPVVDSESGVWHVFDYVLPPEDVPSCLVDDLVVVNSDWPDVIESLAVQPVFVVNAGTTICGLRMPAFSAADEDLALGSISRAEAAPTVLSPGEIAAFIVTYPRTDAGTSEETSTVSFALDGQLVPKVLGEFEVALTPGIRWLGPIVWRDDHRTPTVVIPSPGEGEPVGSTDPITIHGIGTLRAGRAIQDAVDDTGQTLVIRRWGDGSSGCGYGWFSGGLNVVLASPTGHLKDAVVVAILAGPDRSTDFGIKIGSTVEELISTVGHDRLTTELNEYQDSLDYRYTSADADLHHLGLFFRVEPVTNTIGAIEAGLVNGGIGRGEGCA